MKLCITAAGNTLEANTDSSFGRAPWLILVDTETLEFEAIENSGVNATQGAGIAAAQMIKDRGAHELFTGRVGPKARAALEAAGVTIREGLANSSVRDAVSRFSNKAYSKPDAGTSQTGPALGGQCRAGLGRAVGSGMGRGGGGRCTSGRGSGQRGGR